MSLSLSDLRYFKKKTQTQYLNSMRKPAFLNDLTWIILYIGIMWIKGVVGTKSIRLAGIVNNCQNPVGK